MMKELTKKRLKACAIDLGISTALSLTIEYFLRKKVKSEFVHNVVTPTAVFWGLEYAQFKCGGQTIGYKMMGLKLESEDGSTPTCKQILKRCAYRDTLGPFAYLKDREAYEGEDGSRLAQDRFAGTVVKEIE
jgi:uncharacterized RDD family membrane protein YckC